MRIRINREEDGYYTIQTLRGRRLDNKNNRVNRMLLPVFTFDEVCYILDRSDNIEGEFDIPKWKVDPFTGMLGGSFNSFRNKWNFNYSNLY